ncbi:MAG: ATP-binding protein [Desulfobacterales bacterium]
MSRSTDESIHLSPSELEQLLRTAATGGRVIDSTHRIVHLAQMTGASRHRMIGKKCYEKFPSSLCRTPRCLLTRILGGEKSAKWDGARKHPGRRKTMCMLTAVPWQTADGQVRGILEDLGNDSRQAELAKLLKTAERQLEVVSSRLIFAQEEERKRIAYDLHDSLGQSLTAISLSVENHSRIIAKKHVKSAGEIASAVREGTIELHRIIEGLRPPVLDHLGLAAATFWFCRKFETDFPNIFAVPKVDFDDIEIPGTIEISVFRVLQETMSNAAKHGNCDTIDISLSHANEQITLVVKDNGVGFDDGLLGSNNGEDEFHQELGMTIMRERAELLNGSFSVTSAPGSGTTVTASWPLTDEANEQMDRLFWGGGDSWK